MKPRLQHAVLIVVGLGTLLLATPNEAVAQRGHRPVRHTVRVVHPPPRILARLPSAHIGLKLRGASFFYHGGAFYRHGPSGYVVVARPVGALTASLPVGAVRVTVGASVFYRHHGVFFLETGGEYEVVAPPIGASVEALPLGYEIVPMGEEDLYYHEGIYYRYDPGRDTYVIVAPPEGVG